LRLPRIMPGRKPCTSVCRITAMPAPIRRLLTETHVAASRSPGDLCREAYTEAGGTILRDLFTEVRGGYFEDVALLDLLVTGKLGHAADALREAESWKWTEVHLDFPHAHGLRQTFWLLG
jgi:ParB family chromosome partitioning protein